MRRVDDRQPGHQAGVGGGQVPGNRATPIVRHQAGHLPAITANISNQRCNVLHQVFGPVGGHFGGSAGAGVAAQVGCHAVVAAVLGPGKMQQRGIPDKSRFRKTVQKHQHRPARRARTAARQGDAVGQQVVTGLDHGHAWLRKHPTRPQTSGLRVCGLRLRSRSGGLGGWRPPDLQDGPSATGVWRLHRRLCA